MEATRKTYGSEGDKSPVELIDPSFDFITDVKTSPQVELDATGLDNEYRVEPFMSPTTPAYTPSRLAISNSDNEASSSSSERHALDVKRRRVGSETLDKDSASLPEIFAKSRKGLFSSGDEEEDGEKSELDENEKEDKADADFEGFDGDEEGTKGMIADIFGESDAEEEGDFEGFAENEVEKEAVISSADGVAVVATRKDEVHHQQHQQQPQEQVTSDNDEDEGEEFVSDFDRFMSRRREETRRRRRLGRDEEFLNDSDEIIRETISRMRSAADEDRRLLSKNRPATKKLSMLGAVTSLLIRAGMKAALIDNGILSAITDWLSPVSRHTLPSVTIRETLLRHLGEFHIQDPDLLRDSGIGKAVMYLYKHPRETKANKMLAGHLINEWSRPIFNLTSDYGSLTREERKQLDIEHLPKRRNTSKGMDNNDMNQKSSDNPAPLRPGDPGWVNRARVPQPSNKDYVIRPKWNVPADSSAFEEGDADDVYEGDRGRDGSHSMRRRRVQQAQPLGCASSRIEKHIRALAKSAAVRRKTRFVRAVPMSVEGRNMSL